MRYSPTQKLGHQAPKKFRQTKYFNSVEINGDFAYCKSHNFVYQPEKQEELLYNALPCYYTDSRFTDADGLNFYHNAYLTWKRHKDLSLKSCLRVAKKCRNIPKGTIVQIRTSWYYPKKKIDTAYLYKVRKENNFPIEYKIDKPEFSANFTTCEFSKSLTDKLRENGFIVKVFVNSNFLSNMINTAAAYTGSNSFVDSHEDGEVAMAYGYGKKIGFSSHSNSLFGYSNGCENILYNWFGEFNKWSDCIEVSKKLSIDEIVAELKSIKTEPVPA